MIRTFVAIQLPEKVRNHCAGISHSLKNLGLKGSFPSPQSLHLTLKFLGNVEEQILPDLEAALNRSTRGVSPFSIRIGGLGTFPNRTRPRVVWMEVSLEPTLIRLHQNLEKNLAALGFGPQRRVFQPHLTLVRLKSLRQLKALVQFLGTANRDSKRVRFKVPAFHLYRSVLRPQGAEHTSLFSVSLTVSA